MPGGMLLLDYYKYDLRGEGQNEKAVAANCERAALG